MATWEIELLTSVSSHLQPYRNLCSLWRVNMFFNCVSLFYEGTLIFFFGLLPSHGKLDSDLLLYLHSSRNIFLDRGAAWLHWWRLHWGADWTITCWHCRTDPWAEVSWEKGVLRIEHFVPLNAHIARGQRFTCKAMCSDANSKEKSCTGLISVE